VNQAAMFTEKNKDKKEQFKIATKERGFQEKILSQDKVKL